MPLRPDTDLYRNLGDTLLALGDLDQAAAAYHKVVQADPIDFTALQQLGRICLQLRHWDDAEDCFRKVIALKPDDLSSSGYLGVVLSGQGKFDEAVGFLEKAQASAANGHRAEQLLFTQHLREALHNQHAVKQNPRILVTRHPFRKMDFYKILLDWTKLNFPQCLTYFELRILPCAITDWSGYSLHLPWFKDPVQQWSHNTYREAQAIADKCREHGIPIVNPVEKLLNAAKDEGARRIAQAGLRTPQMAEIEDVERFERDLYGLEPPLFIRKNWGHGGPFHRIDSREQAAQVPWERFSRPVAVELVDVKEPDGLFRKYRYFMAGEYGLSHHLIITRHWIAKGSRRVYSEETKAEELAFTSQTNPHHEQFNEARKHLQFDLAAFDYSYDHQGNVVVWEVNPFPFVHFSGGGGRLLYRSPAIHRSLAAMLLMYLERAGFEAPGELRTILAVGTPESDDLVAQLKKP